MKENNNPQFDAMSLTELEATLESVSKDESGETKTILGKNYRAIPFMERYREEPIREMQMPSIAELNEAFLKKLMKALEKESEIEDLFKGIKPDINKIEQKNTESKNREEDDYER